MHGQFVYNIDQTRAWVKYFNRPAPLNEDNFAIGQHFELHGFGQVVGQHGFYKAGRIGQRGGATICIIQAFFAQGVFNTTQQVLQIAWFLVRFGGMAHAGVKCAAAVVFVAPGNGVAIGAFMIGRTHGTALVRRFIQGQQHLHIGVEFLVVIPFIAAVPGVSRDVFSGRMLMVKHLYLNVLYFRMAIEVCARQAAVPFPAIFGIRGGVDAHITAARLNIAFKSIFLLRIEHIAGSIEENDRMVTLQVFFGKGRCVFGGIHDHPVFAAQFAQCSHTRRNAGMAISGCFGKNQEPRWCIMARTGLK